MESFINYRIFHHFFVILLTEFCLGHSCCSLVTTLGLLCSLLPPPSTTVILWLLKFILWLLSFIPDENRICIFLFLFILYTGGLIVHQSINSGPLWLAVLKYIPSHSSFLFTFHIHLLFQFTTQLYPPQSSGPLYTHGALFSSSSCWKPPCQFYSLIASYQFWAKSSLLIATCCPYTDALSWCLCQGIISCMSTPALSIWCAIGILCIFSQRTCTISLLS